MIDETALASGIYESFSKCLALRNKYYDISLQAERNRCNEGAISMEVLFPSR
jgi:hypothetical protein